MLNRQDGCDTAGSPYADWYLARQRSRHDRGAKTLLIYQ
jgi:hypothetical protein